MRVFMHVMNCKPFGVPPTLFWTLDLVAWGWGLVAWCLLADFWGGCVLYAMQVRLVRTWLVLATFS